MRALLKAAGVDLTRLRSIMAIATTCGPSGPRRSSSITRSSLSASRPKQAAHHRGTARLGRLLISIRPTGHSRRQPAGVGAGKLCAHHCRSDGDLLTMPILPASRNRIEATADAQLAPNGSLAAHLQCVYHGQQASRLRYMSTFEKPDEMKRAFEEALTSRLGGLTLQKIEPADRLADDQFQLTMDVAVQHLASIAGTVAHGCTGHAGPPRRVRISGETTHFAGPPGSRSLPGFRHPLRAPAIQSGRDPRSGTTGQRLRHVQSKLASRQEQDPLRSEPRSEKHHGAGGRIHANPQVFEEVESAQNSAVVLLKE